MASSLLDLLASYGLGGGAPTGPYTPILRPPSYDEAPAGSVPGLGLGEQNNVSPGAMPSDAFGGLPVPYQLPQQSLPAWAGGGFGMVAGVPGSAPTGPPPVYNTTPASLNTGGRYSGGPQAVAPGVSALPTQPEAPQPGMAALLGFLNGGLAGAISGGTTGQRTDQAYLLQQQQKNQVKTAEAVYNGLISRGDYHPQEAAALAQAVAGDHEVAKAVLPNLFGTSKLPTTQIGDLKLLTFVDKNKNTRFLLPNENGGVGSGSLDDAIALDLKIKQGKARAEAAGKNQGETAGQLPKSRVMVQQSMKDAEALIGHPGESASTGMLAGHLPAIGGAQAAYVTAFNQLKNEAFLNVIPNLKGLGAMSNKEGDRASEAVFRASRATNTKDRNEALREYQSYIQNAFGALEKQATGDYEIGKPLEQPIGRTPKPGNYNWSPTGGFRQR